MARRRPPQIDGFVIVDKPAGMTSHDVVGVARRTIGERRIGHSGTLDPDATGVLLLGVGRATRLLTFLTALSKTYTGEIVLGTSTSTLDSSGKVTGSYDMAGVTLDDVQRAAAGLVGEILQVPPMVSALKVDGKRLHDLAREGIEVERQPRPVTVYRFDVEATPDPMVFACTVKCSSGTYVRTLAADVGTALGGGAHLRNLRRVAIGSFSVAEASPIDALVVRPVTDAMRDYTTVVVTSELAAKVRQGSVLSRESLGVDGGAVGPEPWVIVDGSGDLLGVYQSHREGTVKPAVVLPAIEGSPGRAD